MVSAIPESGTTARRLGNGEKLWLRLSEEASNNAVFIVTLEGVVDPHRLERALFCAARAFPILRARVGSAAGRPSFIFSRHAQVPLTVEPRITDRQWTAAAEEETSRCIAPTEPLLWRTRLLLGSDSSEFILTFNHALTDSQSLQLLVDAVLRCYAADRDVLTPMGLPPCYERYLAGPGMAVALLGALPGLIASALRKKPAAAAAPLNPNVDPRAKACTRFVFVEIDSARSELLLQACKARGESLHGLLGSFLLLASRDALGGHGETTLAMSAAVNVRPRLQGDFSKEVGYYASGFESRFTLAPGTGTWELASAVNRDAKARFTPANITLSVILKGLILRLKKRARDLVDASARYSKASLHFTNVGRMMVQTGYGDLAVTRIKPLPSVHFMNKPMVCLESHFFNGSLQLTFSYSAPLTDPAFVAGLTARYQERIDTAIGPVEDLHSPEEQQKGKPRATALTSSTPRIPTSSSPPIRPGARVISALCRGY